MLNGEMKVGMKAIVIGASTAHGQQFIGCEVRLEQFVAQDEMILVGVKHPRSAHFLADKSGWIVSRNGLTSHLQVFEHGYGAFASKHLMPIPPLEDPGINECTFTPIIQKEKA